MHFSKQSILISKKVNDAINFLNVGVKKNLSGCLAKSLNSEVLYDLVQEKKINLITGTRGTTSTSNLIGHILKIHNVNTAYSKTSASSSVSIISSILDNITDEYTLDIDCFTQGVNIEKLNKIIKEFIPDNILITNILNNKISHNNNISIKKNIENIIKLLASKKDFKLFLNADDPLLSNLKIPENIDTVWFGINNIKYLNSIEKFVTSYENILCPKCKSILTYQKRFYGTLGHYDCKCGFSRSKLDISADVDISESSRLRVSLTDDYFEILSNRTELYGIYNILATIAFCLQQNIPKETIVNGLNSFNSVFALTERLYLNSKVIYIQTIKDSISMTESIKRAMQNKNSKILFIINETNNISWLWDAKIELLKNCNQDIIISGNSANQLLLRLKHENIIIDKSNIIENIDDALNQTLKNIDYNEKLHIMTTANGKVPLKDALIKI